MGQKETYPAPGPGGVSDVEREGARETRPITAADLAAEKARLEKLAFEQAAQQLQDAVRGDPALADLAKQLTIDMTPEGLRIQIVDEVKLPMFPSGSATPNERARLLLQKVTPVLMRLTQPISIAGHTDAAPFPGPERTNWELSAERANATRRLLVDGGFPEARVKSVTGNADRDPLLPADPLAAANRRIAILVLREAPLAPAATRSAGPSGLVPSGLVPSGLIRSGAPANVPAGNSH
jgi:chemotaxis protein MotB